MPDNLVADLVAHVEDATTPDKLSEEEALEVFDRLAEEFRIRAEAIREEVRLGDD